MTNLRRCTVEDAAELTRLRALMHTALGGWLEEHLPQPGTLDGRRGHLASMSSEPEHQRCGHGLPATPR